MKIKIVNQSKKIPRTGVGNGSITEAVGIMNVQLQQWKRYWFGADHAVYSQPSSWDWEILVVDNPDVADALGYHDVTPGGKPYGKVFIDVCQEYGVPWISVLSHEVLELVGDPGANQWAHDLTGKLWAFEMCDAVQDHLYTINGTKVSDFVLPNFFIPGSPPPYDYLQVLTRPFTINQGYSIVSQITSVSQIFGFFKAEKKHASIISDEEGDRVLRRPDKQHPASRTQRRLRSFDNVK